MMESLYRAVPVALVFLTDALLAWVWGGTRTAPLLQWMPWVALLALQVLLFYPQRQPWESAAGARKRVWRALGRDPLTWTATLFLALQAIALVNEGLCADCDRAAILGGENPKPPMPYFPWCVDVAEHAEVFMWIAPAFVAMLAVKHALVWKGRRVFLEMLVWNGALIAVYGFVLIALKAGAPYMAGPLAEGERAAPFFATFGYANMAGSYFVFMSALSIGIWRQRWYEACQEADARAKDPKRPRYLWLKGHYPLFAVVFNFFGALCSLSRAAIIASLVLLALTFVYIFAGLFYGRRRQRIHSVKSVAWSGLGVLVFVISIFIFAPEPVTRELKGLTSFEALDRVTGKGQYHAHVAVDMFKDHPFFGVGFWGYRHHCRTYMTGEEQQRIQMDGGANVHQDYLQFLCEFGSVGTALLLAVFVLLLMPALSGGYKLYQTSKFTRPHDKTDVPNVAFSLPAPIFWTLAGVAFVAIHACGDCPLRSGAVVSALLTSLAAVDGFLPQSARKD